jgi:hypothetical protein
LPVGTAQKDKGSYEDPYHLLYKANIH